MTSTQPAPAEQRDQVPTLAAALAAVVLVRRMALAAEMLTLQALRRAVSRVLRQPERAVTVEARAVLVRDVAAVAARLEVEAAEEITKAVSQAHRAGEAAADADLRAENKRVPTGRTAAPTPPAVAERRHLVSSVESIHRSIVSTALATEGPRPNRLDVAQRALNEFSERGITVFLDKAGRAWSIDTYTEMAVRTAVTAAHVDAYVARARAAGEKFLQISYSVTCCPLCLPYDGKIIAIADLPAARVAGLFHPNCKHTVSIVQRDAPPIVRPAPDPAVYEAQQRLRYLERRVRAAKRRLAVALDDAARRKAQAEVRAAQAAIREHIDQTGIQRQRAREQIGRPR